MQLQLVCFIASDYPATQTKFLVTERGQNCLRIQKIGGTLRQILPGAEHLICSAGMSSIGPLQLQAPVLGDISCRPIVPASMQPVVEWGLTRWQHLEKD